MTHTDSPSLSLPCPLKKLEEKRGYFSFFFILFLILSSAVLHKLPGKEHQPEAVQQKPLQSLPVDGIASSPTAGNPSAAAPLTSAVLKVKYY